MKKKRIILTLLLLMLISIINIFYARNLSSSFSNLFIKQIIWYLLCFFIIFLLTKINIAFILNHSLILYILGNLLLVITLIFGSTINGSTSWINIGPFSIEPSEFMKIFIILYLRDITIKKKYKGLKYFIFSFIIVLIPSLLTFLEHDTGPIFSYITIFIVFLFLNKVNKKYIYGMLIFALVLGITFFTLYYKYNGLFISLFGSSFFYRMDRIENFINGKGYQINQAIKSISSSVLFGLSDKIYFPESATDFAFTLLISNFGIIGMIFFLIIFAYFIISCLYFKDKTIVYPFIFILLWQYSSNILMNVGLFPIIGITLPFISYGGSSLLSFMIIIGLLISEKNKSYL